MWSAAKVAKSFKFKAKESELDCSQWEITEVYSSEVT